MPPEYVLVDEQAPEIVVEQAASEFDCPIIDLGDGRTLYLVWLSLVAERSGVRLWDYRFVPPWPDQYFQPLATFAESHIGQSYILPSGLQYPRDQVLNLKFIKAGWRLPCTRVEGLLCALSETPIPDEYQHGEVIPIGVTFFGRSGQQLGGATVRLWADRWDARHAHRATAKPPVAEGAHQGLSAPRAHSSVFEEQVSRDEIRPQREGGMTPGDYAWNCWTPELMPHEH